MSKRSTHLIYLTGFMGSGKSTIAPILANTLGYACIDIDAEIEQATGKSVSDIFLEMGEPYFREAELKLLARTSHEERSVISLGGGTIANGNNLELVKASGILVYLKTDAEQIFRRMRFKSDRPMLIGPDGRPLSDEALRERIQLLLARREPYYHQADIMVPTDDLRIGLTVDEIVRQLKQFSA